MFKFLIINTFSKKNKMRAFTICALSAATAYAASGPKGDYDYTTGGENWYKLDGNAVCGTGKS